MLLHPIRHPGYLALALLLIAPRAAAIDAAALPATEAGAYWNSIAEKRRGRNAKRRERQTIALDDYVLTQPPVYTGPRRPVNPSPEPSEPVEPRQRNYIPVVADLLKA